MNALPQARIVEALLRTTFEESSAADAIPDPRLRRALAVHRGTVRHALIEALREAFPAVRAAVGEEYFRALAAEFVARHPPRSPVLQEYGDGFAHFAAGFPPLRDWPWLADLARIDWARREAYHAADAAPMAILRWPAQDAAALLAMRFELHPSLRLLESPHPLASLWFAHQPDAGDPGDGGGDASVDVVWTAEACRVWRIGERVHVERTTASEVALLRALAQGRSLLLALWDAFDGALDQARIAPLLQRLIDDRLIVAVHPLAANDARTQTDTPTDTHAPE